MTILIIPKIILCALFGPRVFTNVSFLRASFVQVICILNEEQLDIAFDAFAEKYRLQMLFIIFIQNLYSIIQILKHAKHGEIRIFELNITCLGKIN